jgi:predicted nucleic acid-binding Zn ribbon protein
MDCIDNNICNCKRDCKCDYGYECCIQDAKNPTLGICVKTGCCDKKRGLPSKDCLESKKCKNVENYNEPTKKDISFLLLLILTLLLIFYKKMLKSYK